MLLSWRLTVTAMKTCSESFRSISCGCRRLKNHLQLEENLLRGENKPYKTNNNITWTPLATFHRVAYTLYTHLHTAHIQTNLANVKISFTIYDRIFYLQIWRPCCLIVCLWLLRVFHRTNGSEIKNEKKKKLSPFARSLSGKPEHDRIFFLFLFLFQNQQYL